jgi:hypothetical protein
MGTPRDVLLEHIRQLFHGTVHVLNALDPPHPPHQQHYVEVGNVGRASDAMHLVCGAAHYGAVSSQFATVPLT